MTVDQIIKIVDSYSERLKKAGFSPQNTAKDNLGSLMAPQHVLWMCNEIKTIAPKDMEKACRWLGFIQGVLWVRGTYTISEMREHTR